MAAKSWKNPRVVQLPSPLHPLPKHPERWFPEYNLDDGLPEEEHLHKFMVTVNLNEFLQEDYVVRIFSYTFQ